MFNKNSILTRLKLMASNYQKLLDQKNSSVAYSDNPIIASFKKGNKIKIKKKNRGLFTQYCGGNVTEECIRRGKNSSDPKIRKRATFAKNSRSWHHS